MAGIEPTNLDIDSIYSRPGKYGFPETEAYFKVKTRVGHYDGLWIDNDSVKGLSDGDRFELSNSEVKPSDHPELQKQLDEKVADIFNAIGTVAGEHKNDTCDTYKNLFDTEYLECGNGLKFEYNSTSTKFGDMSPLWESSTKPNETFSVGMSFAEGNCYAAHVTLYRRYMRYARVDIYGTSNPHFQLFAGATECMKKKIDSFCGEVYKQR